MKKYIKKLLSIIMSLIVVGGTANYAYCDLQDDLELYEVSLTPIEIQVEDPVITDNVPEVINVGDSFVLETALTNVNLENRKVAEYDDPANWNQWDEEHLLFAGNGQKYFLEEADTPAYRPLVTIIEGKEIVEQSNQDYSNTLSTSETLTFKGEGVVKLKITYNQIKTCAVCLDEKDMYSPEKIITITVQNENQVPTKTTKDEIMLGDVNLDGKITLVDAQLALKAALGIIELDELQAEAADVNGKDGITLTDAKLILKSALGIIASFDERTV